MAQADKYHRAVSGRSRMPQDGSIAGSKLQESVAASPCPAVFPRRDCDGPRGNTVSVGSSDPARLRYGGAERILSKQLEAHTFLVSGRESFPHCRLPWGAAAKRAVSAMRDGMGPMRRLGQSWVQMKKESSSGCWVIGSIAAGLQAAAQASITRPTDLTGKKETHRDGLGGIRTGVEWARTYDRRLVENKDWV
ncbi:hypothetical protein IAQ61_006337, partial [Plenodomus lingam]|uniref:uncharacterized protein n=1 Tax=Leptosphaeria maculans TaxID=5022 RepID=UPI003331A424